MNEPTTVPTIAIVTGVSGAGKSTALRAFEDLGYYCVDNLPTALATEAVRLLLQGGVARIALGIDVRVGTGLTGVGAMLDGLAAHGALAVLFCDASDEALLRRFSETRRPHALATQSGPGVASVASGLTLERERLSPLRARATTTIDTTTLSVHDLRRFVFATFGGQTQKQRLRLRFISFGFKYGNPVDADLVFDVRFLENPYFVAGLRHVPGTDARVRDFVLGLSDTSEFLKKVIDLLTYVLPKYEREGKSYLTVAIGCTGGRHRSVVVAEALARHFGAQSEHRDVQKGLAGRRDPDASGEFGPQRELAVQVAPTSTSVLPDPNDTSEGEGAP